MYGLGELNGQMSYGKYTIENSLIKINKDQLKNSIDNELSQLGRADDTEEVKKKNNLRLCCK